MTAKALQLNLRCTAQEDECIRSMATAIGMDVSSFFELGLILATVDDLKMLLIDPTPPRSVLRPWRFAPARRTGDVASARLTCNIEAHLFPTVHAAASVLQLKAPRFAIGAALRLAALEKVLNEQRRREGGVYDARVARVRVPYGFEELVRSERAATRK